MKVNLTNFLSARLNFKANNISKPEQNVKISNTNIIAFKGHEEIKKLSNKVEKKSEKIVADSEKIKEKAQELMYKIKDTHSYNLFRKGVEGTMPSYGAYVTSIKLGDEVYDVKIAQDKIRASRKDILGQKGKKKFEDIYEFDTESQELRYYAKNQREFSRTTQIDREYFFSCGNLMKCNIGVHKAENYCARESFKYVLNRYDEHMLGHFSKKAIMSPSALSAETFLLYSDNELRGYAHDESPIKNGLIDEQVVTYIN